MSTITFAHPSAERDSLQLTAGLDVLIAEDNADGAETLAFLLERAGHEVRVVYDGMAAVASALIDPPDAIILDIGLPKLDGWQVARRIRNGLRGRPCLMIAVTGYDTPEDRNRSRAAGIDRHLAKPIDPDALVAALERYHGPGKP
ncbi:MAG TPA: response regulator [Gemmataceae bacterium]|jgi:CheY-like chemotaxis protein